MTVNNSPENTANNESQNSGQSDGVTVSQSEVREAVSNTAAASNIDPDNMTPKQLVELINALPDRIVDAIKEAAPAKTVANPQPEEKPVESSKSGLFGGKSFGEWWVGK
jgi:hypothetical protein